MTKTICEKEGETLPPLEIEGEELLKISRLYKVLSDKNRLSIVYALCDGSMCVHELEKLLNISQSLVSHQLKILRDAKIVKASQRKNERVYSLMDEHILHLLKLSKEHIEE